MYSFNLQKEQLIFWISTLYCFLSFFFLNTKISYPLRELPHPVSHFDKQTGPKRNSNKKSESTLKLTKTDGRSWDSEKDTEHQPFVPVGSSNNPGSAYGKLRVVEKSFHVRESSFLLRYIPFEYMFYPIRSIESNTTKQEKHTNKVDNDNFWEYLLKSIKN